MYQYVDKEAHESCPLHIGKKKDHNIWKLKSFANPKFVPFSLILTWPTTTSRRGLTTPLYYFFAIIVATFKQLLESTSRLIWRPM